MSASPNGRRSPSWRPIVLELLLALVSFHLLLLFTFRRYPAPLSWLDGSFLVGIMTVFVLSLMRVGAGRETEKQTLPLRDRLQPGRWLHGLGRPGLILLGGLLATSYTLHEYGGRLGSDGTMFFIYTRSIVIDQDLDLRNEFEQFVPAKFQHIALRAEANGTSPQPPNELGPALFWLPFYTLAHLAIKIGGVFGGTIPADGYSYPYINAVCVAGLFWAFVGVVLSYRLVRRYYEPELVAWGALVLWFASPLLWYTVYEPTMPHAVSLAAVAMFLSCWLRARDRGGLTSWTWAALSAGLMLSVQLYNVFFLVAPLLDVSGRFLKYTAKKQWPELRGTVWRTTFFVLGMVIATAPIWYFNLSASATLVRAFHYPSRALLYWKNPYISEFLFSSKQGLFSWTPAATLSVIGLVLLLRRIRSLAIVSLVTLSVGVYMLSSTWDEGYSFGSRRLTEAFPIFLLGWCRVLEVAKASPQALITLFSAVLVAWNILLASQLRRAEIPQMSTFAFSEASSRGVERVYETIGHPFAIPANWIFAWVYGVPPDRFDTVWGHRAYHNLSIDVGTPSDSRFVGRGWSVPEAAATGETYRWSDAEASSWLVRLFEPYRYRLSLIGEAVPGPSDVPQRIAIEVNGAAAGLVSLGAGKSVAEAIIPQQFWRVGLNEIVFRYSHTVHAEEIGGGADPRRIALRLERLELRIEK